MILKLSLALAAAMMASAVALAGPAMAQAPLVDYEAAAKSAPVSEAAQWRIAFRPTVSVLSQSVAQLRTLPGLAPERLAEADRLVAQAPHEPEADARRTLWRAATLLLGRPWSPGQELLGALALRTDSPISEGGRDRVRLEELYPTKDARAQYAIDLFRAEPTTSATPKRGALVRRLAEGESGGGAARPIAIDLSGAPDGAYLLIATLKTSDGARAELAQSLYVVRSAAARSARLRAQLRTIRSHEAAKAVAEYPYALAEGLRAGTREVISYDFPRALARSAEIARDLARGQDDVWQARGLQSRAYAFAPTGELIPYQLYVPSNWTPARRWPVVVALHGANLDETNMLGRSNGAMQKLAEAHGFIVVTPLGYRLNSGYGSERGLNAVTGRDPVRLHRSEDDVLQVLAKVEAEYNVDPARRYLTGNSMGGAGTWWIGGHHPELWAAIAPAAYGGVLPEDVAGLRKAPVMAVVGDHDELGMLARVRASVAVLEAGGVHPQYVEVPGGTHASAYETAMPRIFDFFSQQAK